MRLAGGVLLAVACAAFGRLPLPSLAASPPAAPLATQTTSAPAIPPAAAATPATAPPTDARPAANLDAITVQGNKAREEVRREVDQFVHSAMVHYWDRPLLRWSTPVCPLVAGLPLDQGEFMLRRLSLVIHSVDAPLAPEKCKPNFLVLVTSQPDELLANLRKKRPQLFDLHDGMGKIKHFLKTDRPVRVWFDWEYGGGGAALATAAAITGSASPSAAGAGGDYPILNSANSRLSYSAPRSINAAIIAVDLPAMKGVNLAQLSDYVAMVGLAELNLDQDLSGTPSVLRLFSRDGGAPTDGMSFWDTALLKSLYSSRPTDVQQISAMEDQMVDVIARH